MEFLVFLLFLGGLIFLLMVFSLRHRVERLELQVKKLQASFVEPQKSSSLSGQTAPSPAATGLAAQTPWQTPQFPTELLGYIEQQRKLGVPDTAISDALTLQGWQAPLVNGALAQKTPTNSYGLDLPPQDDVMSHFAAWIKDNWLMKLGAFLLLIGFGWLTTYAFMNNWIGPMGRIALGITAGAIILVIGWWRIFKYIHQGGIFLVLGSTVILMTTFAAREMYGFFTPTSALAIMFLSVLFVAVASVKFNSKALALASLILAGLAPLFTAAPKSDYVSLFAYLLIVVLGTIWIVLLTGMRDLTAAALLMVVFYSLPHWSGAVTADTSILFFFAFVLSGVFFITNTAGILKLGDKELKPDILAAAGNSLFLLAWIQTSASPEWKSIIIAAWMVVFAVGAFVIYKVTGRKQPFYIYSGISVGFLGAATAAELSGPTLVIAFIIEAAIVSLITYWVTLDIKLAQRMNTLFLVPIILSLPSFGARSWNTGVFHEDFVVLLLLGACMLALGSYYLPKVNEDPQDSKNINSALLILGSYYLYALLWYSLHAAFGYEGRNAAVAIAMIVYTVIGLTCYFYAQAAEKRGLKIYGGILIGFVVFRLLIVDIWSVAMPVRIVMFFLIGALLMSTAFLGKKKT